ncbi:MAG: GNAT family N-acetyltransferase [Clostridia bacterium]|nr:GNAT family N-acetyltransferase [Clostridia bacterium]
MTQILLRPIETGDAPFLHTLMNTPALMARLHQPATTLRDWEDAIALWHSDPDEKGYIVTEDEQPIGWFAVNDLLSPSRIPYIKMAVLLPEHQHRGIGRKVIEQLCSQLQSEGYPAVRLFTDADNLPAQRCYQGCGFRIIATLEEPWPDGSTLLRCEMEKKL